MNRKSDKIFKVAKNDVTILNEKIKTPVPRKLQKTSSETTSNDVQVVTVKKVEESSPKQTKMDHYVLKTLKNEYDHVSDDGETIDIVLAVDSEEENHDEENENTNDFILPEELELTGELEENDSSEHNENFKEVVEHICGKCFKTFRRLKGLKKHLDFCRMDSGYHIRKQEMIKNISKIEQDAYAMENKDVCFCCGESYDTCHLGHISCPDCPKSFKSQLSYERHIFITHSENDDYPCSTCNARMRSHKLLELHEEQHKNRGKPFACKICGKEFTRAYHLKRHQKYSSCSNDISSTVSCKVCHKVFYRLDNLRVHLKTHLGPQTTKKPEYMCPTCKNCFYSLSTLNIHTRTHTGEKPFECDLCDKKFSVLVALKKHRRYHTGEKPYTCTVCNSSFAVKEVLNRHMKRHTGEKNHKCDDCGKAFIQATQLRNHMKTHIRPFPCKMCEEKFKTQKALDRHIKVHRRDSRKSYCCDICKIYFDTISEHALHMEKGQHVPTSEEIKSKRKTKAKQRRDCAVCGTYFSNASALNFHILKVHEQDPEEFINEIPGSNGSNQDGVTILNSTSPTRGRRSRLAEKSMDYEPPSKICKIEKDLDGEGLTIIPDDDPTIVTHVDAMAPNKNSGLVVSEFIIDEPQNNPSDTIILNDKEFTIIPLDTFTTVDTSKSSAVINKSPGEAVKPKTSNRLNKEQRISLGASLAAAIGGTKKSDSEAEDSDSEDDSKPTEDDILLKEKVKQLLDILIDSETLHKFGWPNASEEQTLCKVIENCGHDLSKDSHNYKELDFGTRMREYVKLMLTVVIPNDSLKDLLNNYQIDEVIDFVLDEEDDDVKPPNMEKAKHKFKV